jgi:hypothetical protein
VRASTVLCLSHTRVSSPSRAWPAPRARSHPRPPPRHAIPSPPPPCPHAQRPPPPKPTPAVASARAQRRRQSARAAKSARAARLRRPRCARTPASARGPRRQRARGARALGRGAPVCGRGAFVGDETCPVSTGGRDAACPLSTKGVRTLIRRRPRLTSITRTCGGRGRGWGRVERAGTDTRDWTRWGDATNTRPCRAPHRPASRRPDGPRGATHRDGPPTDEVVERDAGVGAFLFWELRRVQERVHLCAPGNAELRRIGMARRGDGAGRGCSWTLQPLHRQARGAVPPRQRRRRRQSW